MRNTNRTARPAAILAGLILAGTGVQAAHADYQTPTPDMSGWVWRLPNGEVWGSCSTGYHPVWNRVGDPTDTVFRLTNGRQVDGASDHLTWAQIEQARTNGDAWGPQTVGFDFTHPETSLGNDAAPNDGKVYEGDCVTDGYTYPKGDYDGDPHGPGKIVPIPQPVPMTCTTTTTTPGQPIWGDKTTTTPGKPIYRDQPIPGATYTFQVDTYLPVHKAGTWLNGRKLTKDVALTAAERTTLARLDDDNRLADKEDRTLWGASAVRFVTVTEADAVTAGGWAQAIGRRTGLAVLGNITTVKPGEAYTKAWALTPGSTTAAPFKGGAQVDADALPKPARRTIRVQVGTTPPVVTHERVQIGTTPATTTTETTHVTAHNDDERAAYAAKGCTVDGVAIGGSYGG